MREYRQTPQHRAWEAEYQKRRVRERGAEKQRYYALTRTLGGKLIRLARDIISRRKKTSRECDVAYLHEVAKTVPTACACCGTPFDITETDRKERKRGPSFDRVDSTKGYIKGNVAIICHRCNMIKKDVTAAELRQIASYIDAKLLSTSNPAP